MLSNPKTDDNVKVMRKLSLLVQLKQTNKARSGYTKLLTIAKGELAAEALYYDAYFKNKDGKFETSNSSKIGKKLFRLPIFWCQRFNSNGQEFLRIER
jgi:hypothetical protein